MGKLIFITGGARSGKSSFALRQASSSEGRKVYIATAVAIDAEMRERIERHRQDRGSGWDTVEEPLRIADAVRSAGDGCEVIVLDCLTLWLSNLMMGGLETEEETESFCHAVSAVHCPVYVVSNEVGMGIVPENAVARRFRDLAGRMNQRIAGAAAEVYFVAAGLPLKIKG